MTDRFPLLRAASLLVLATAALAPAAAQQAARSGPYDVDVAAGGAGLSRPMQGVAEGTMLPAAGGWSLSGWVEPRSTGAGTVAVAGVGTAGQGRFLALDGGAPAVIVGGTSIRGGGALQPGRWRHLAASSDGRTVRLYLDGQEVAHGEDPGTAVAATVEIGPRAPDGLMNAGFAGRVAGFTAGSAPMSAAAIAQAAREEPDPALTNFDQGAATWPVQVRQMYGQTAPQDAWTRPQSATPPQKAVAKPAYSGPALVDEGNGRWNVAAWTLAEQPKVAEDSGAAISKPDYNARSWYAATVPGTVLTTLVDRGVYPTPEYGLNNLAIPERLAHQDYWYRSEFTVPAAAQGKRLFLTFKGVNYAGEVWVNGERVGGTTGAFIRGQFDLTGKLIPGQRNAVAVRVSPPPHPGLPHEESLTSGVGENGGMMMLDGPTFVASEGWDWIPTLRDRNTGMWQGVELAAIGEVKIGDAQVITSLPNPDNSVANVEIDVPLKNLSGQATTGQVTAAFDGITVTKQVPLAAGAEVIVKLTPAEFPQLAVQNPKLWWPNGYGDPVLHDLTVTSAVGGQASDTKKIRFGMREVTYEMSLFDQAGTLRRVEIDLTKAHQLNQQIVDYSHEGIRKTPNGWAASLMPGAEASPAVTPISGDDSLSPYLVIRVNGVRIAARGGNIGMDDFMKRVSRERLEPYFKLHKDAHLNIVRNWVGQNTEETFYDLADEYGLMILNDFWESTQDYNIESQDERLFEANAEDVIKRFRNHPSIVVWFGRNEGVPQPLLNEGLESLVNNYDGTRLYLGSSNRVNLQNSGPYNWRPPVEYFTEHAKGFAVELGTPSFPTLEAWKRAIPKTELWPISDTWAYHDWHQTGNGAVKSFMDAMATEFGPATSLEDFERKAQMVEYDAYRAIFEGFNAGLWKTTSARMLWMTQPAWPSSAWQIFSHDYDTHGAFYGVKKASQPVHVQMNLPDFKVILVNNTREAVSGLTVRARVESLDGRVLLTKEQPVSAEAGQTADAYTLDLAPLFGNGAVLVRLEAVDGSGKTVSDNFYWQGRDLGALQALNGLGQAALSGRASSRRAGAEVVTTVELANTAKVAALATKLTAVNADGSQVLPAFFSDNYVSLLPGERKSIEVRYPASAAKGAVTVTIRGWNVKPAGIKAGRAQ